MFEGLEPEASFCPCFFFFFFFMSHAALNLHLEVMGDDPSALPPNDFQQNVTGFDLPLRRGGCMRAGLQAETGREVPADLV